jgi:hypothetical protein
VAKPLAQIRCIKSSSGGDFYDKVLCTTRVIIFDFAPDSKSTAEFLRLLTDTESCVNYNELCLTFKFLDRSFGDQVIRTVCAKCYVGR